MTFGERLKSLREEKELSQTKFGEIFNVKQYTISNWEKGRAEPDIEMIKMIAQYFEITTDELLGNEITYHENGTETLNPGGKSKKS